MKAKSNARHKYGSNKILKLGLVGSGRIASRFVKEARFVSGVDLTGVFGLFEEELKDFSEDNGLSFHSTNFNEFINNIDAVYIASPHLTHYGYIKKALLKGKHVLCEKPMVLSVTEAKELFQLAKEKKLVLLEALKTAFAPGFIQMVIISKSGLIGKIKNIDATFTKLVSGHVRELQKETAGGSITELSSYPLLAAVRLMGTDYKSVMFYSYFDEKHKVDMFSKLIISYADGIFSGKVGLGVKSEGDLIVSGTKGYIYVPSPWWKTECFEARFEDFSENQKFCFSFEGDGLRYELEEFISMIHKRELETDKLIAEESISIIRIIEQFIKGDNVNYFS
jgi:predicted dehydrogenase